MIELLRRFELRIGVLQTPALPLGYNNIEPPIRIELITS